MMRDFESEMVKAPILTSDCGSKEGVNLSSSTAVSRLNVVKDEKPWYNEGLSFKCTECGQCCTGSPGYIWVSDEEILALAEHLNLSLDAFSSKYLRLVDGRISLLERPFTFDCVFLENKKCTVYSLRPKQCRTFPWWPQNLKSPEDWKNAAKYCEGIRDQVEKVPFSVISQQLSIQEEK